MLVVNYDKFVVFDSEVFVVYLGVKDYFEEFIDVVKIYD